MADEARMRLVVFSDDWGRHPSSCQHLVSSMLPGVEVLWVNTVGMRRPRVSAAEAKRVGQVVRGWMRGGGGGDGGAAKAGNGLVNGLANGLSVVRPRMYPGFRSRWQRRLNARLIARQVNRAIAGRWANKPNGRTVAVTTLPITADLVGRLAVDRWVYYCVDDFSVWPGLDGAVMSRMERAQVGRMDVVVAASQVLGDRLAALGTPATVLTHGVDLGHWRKGGGGERPRWLNELNGLNGPVFVFWGLVDARLDVAWCMALAKAAHGRGGALVLAGPGQNPPGVLAGTRGLRMPGAVAYARLPALAAAADVLVMPYADLAVTRAMQPLKLTEYLATGKPAVVRDLPATRPWADAADVVDDAGRFVETALERAKSGLPSAQATARERLDKQTWSEKAKRFMDLVAQTPI